MGKIAENRIIMLNGAIGRKSAFCGTIEVRNIQGGNSNTQHK